MYKTNIYQIKFIYFDRFTNEEFIDLNPNLSWVNETVIVPYTHKNGQTTNVPRQVFKIKHIYLSEYLANDEACYKSE